MALFLKFVWSYWKISHLMFLKFLVVCVCGRSFLNEYGVLLLGLCCPCQFLGAISTVFVDVCLEKKEGILGGEADIYLLPRASHWDEGVGTVKPVYIGESLRMGGDSIKSVCPVHLVDRYG